MKKLFKKLENKLSVFNNQKPTTYFTFVFYISIPIQIILSKLNKIILPTQKPFLLNVKKGSFSNKWFDNNISLFFIVLFFLKMKNLFWKTKILELGSWEGRSSLFIISFSKNFFLTCVDTWEGADEHKNNKNLNSIFKKFNNNLANFIGINLKIEKTNTSDFFKNQNLENKYDLIYVDASHKAEDAFLDLANSINHVKNFSFIIIDDYLWQFYKDFKKNPGWGVNLFMRSKPNRIIIPIFVSYQVLLLIL